MAAITPVVTRQPLPNTPHTHLLRWAGTGTANQADTMSTVTAPTVGVHARGGTRRLMYVTIAYSDVPTYTGTALTVRLDSGSGAGFDSTLAAGTDNTRYFSYTPSNDLWIMGDDEIIVAAPAAGGVITASILIAMEGH